MGDVRIRVLLADDHAILRQGIRSLLEREPGVEVVGEAGDGQEAVEKAAELQPDVVLMDINMPRMNGIEATRRIRETHDHIKILVLSMHEDDEYVAPLMQAGASGYVLKRSAASELLTALKAVNQGHTILPAQLARTAFDGSAPARQDDFDGLTPREIEVLTLVAEGYTNRRIAEELFISIKTVQAHRANIMEKLGLHDAVELTKYAIRKGIIKLED